MSIITYTIRRPGHTAWRDRITTRYEALVELGRAEMVISGHSIYAEHVDGTTEEVFVDGKDV
jgi:hypothetical protein